MIPPPLQFAFRIRINFPTGPRLRFPVRGGDTRGYINVVSGIVEGPKLQGTLVPGGGGDCSLFRADGVVVFDARYLIQATDGTLIQVFNRGFAYAAPEVTKRIERGAPVDAADNYFRLSPVFETADGPHAWLTRTVFVGYGEKFSDYSTFDYFAVT